MTLFREANNPDGTHGPVSIRRVLAAFFAATFGALAVSITLHFAELAALGNAAIGVAGVLLGAPLVGVLLLLFFTTWSDVAAIAKAVSGGSTAGQGQ
jgi:hypothetical protein